MREPLTRARVRLLGPCFKTGRVGGRHRRGPRALASWRPRRDPRARRRDPPGAHGGQSAPPRPTPVRTWTLEESGEFFSECLVCDPMKVSWDLEKSWRSASGQGHNVSAALGQWPGRFRVSWQCRLHSATVAPTSWPWCCHWALGAGQ